MLLLHAFPLDGDMWGELAGRRVDYPGEGSLAGWADRAAAQLSEPDVVCGLSMGGYAALELVRRHPAAVRALVLADTRAAADSDEARRGRDENIAVVERDGAEALWARLAPNLLAPDADPAAAERARRIALRQPRERLVAMLRALRDRRDSTEALPGIGVPVLVVCGEHDAITPPAACRRLVEALPHGRYVEIAGAGHLSALERPDAFADAVRAFAADA